MQEGIWQRWVCLIICMLFSLGISTTVTAADKQPTVIFVPQDNRPISGKQSAQVLTSMNYTVEMPSPDILGGRTNNADIEALNKWLLEHGDNEKVAVISADTLIYGGLVASRKHHLSTSELSQHIMAIKKLHRKYPKMPIYLFASIMRTPKDGASSGTEDADYYKQYGKAIASYTKIDNADTSGLNERYRVRLREEIPAGALRDWQTRRRLNLAVNKALIDLVNNGEVEYLILGLDDNAKHSPTDNEGHQLTSYARSLGLPARKVNVLTGIDEIAALTMMRIANSHTGYQPAVYIGYAPGFGRATIPTYSNESIDTTAAAQVYTIGGHRVFDYRKADLILLINTNQSGWTYDANTPINTTNLRFNSQEFFDTIKALISRGYRVSIGDIAFANGSDNALMEYLKQEGLLAKLYGYAGWNTATNSTGFALAMGVANTQLPIDRRRQLLLTRYLDDWGYQANVRQDVNGYLTLLPGEGDYLNIGKIKLSHAETYGTRDLRQFIKTNLQEFPEAGAVVLSLPWNRIFEADIQLEDHRSALRSLLGR